VKIFPPNLNFETPRVRRRTAFTLIEILVAMVLMTLIVLALMAVFNSTQTAFRAGLTQSDVLESGRATMNLIRSDLETMTPSDGYGIINGVGSTNIWAMNFYVAETNYPSLSPLYQTLAGSSQQRTNILDNFFFLSRGNVNGSDSWIGTGYTVVTNSPDGSLYSLYRFTTNYPVMTVNPAWLFYNNSLSNFSSFLQSPANYGSHLMDGVVDFQVRAFNSQGAWINVNTNNIFATNYDATGEVGLYSFYSNAVPASVEIEMGVVEDKTLQHAESLESAGGAAVTSYLAQHAGQVHIFRQRVPIRNVDPTAYQ
jgi:type II secretory pathway pseudopilin PulG